MISSRRPLLLAIVAVIASLHLFATQAQPGQSGAVRLVGTVKAISGANVTLAPDAGSEVRVSIPDGARMLRMAPGQQDLKSATPIQLSEMQVGDRILVRGKMSDDNKSLLAASVIVMKQSDLAEKRQQDLRDWQRRGVGGLVKSVDPASGVVTISTMSPTGPKPVAIKVSNNTVIRRYSPDSVRFDDAKISTIGEIKPGDQVRARGEKNADGTELSAEEIVTGAFRNIAGTIQSVDAAGNTITVMDLATKKPAVIHISAESQMHKLPEMVARGLAMRLKGGPEGQNASSGRPGPPEQAVAAREGGMRPQAGGQPGSGPGGPEGRPRTGGGDLQQLLSRLPAMPFTDLQKGDAVMVVSTPGTTTSNMTAITLLSGVEPILTASPNGSGAASLLTPWTLASAPEGGGPQ